MERRRPGKQRGERKPAAARRGKCGAASRTAAGILALLLAPCAAFAAQVLSIEGVGMVTSNYAVELSEGDVLEAGRFIRTNSFATCTLGWTGSSDKVVLEPSSNAELVGESPIRFRLETGKIRFTGKDVEVATALATATSKRAGSYAVSLREGKEIVEVADGEAAVVTAAKKESYELHGGEELTIGGDGSAEKGPIAAPNAAK